MSNYNNPRWHSPKFHAAITPSDTVPVGRLQGEYMKGIKVTVTGNVAIKDDAGTIVVYPVTAGDVLPFSAAYIMATGTTATVVAWY